MIDLNDSKEFISELTIFNDGKAGVAINEGNGVQVTITKKGADDKEDAPDYKLIAKDDKGEVNEGFYYYDNADDAGFKKFQAGKLIMLARGVFGDDVKFPAFNTPKEALDEVMKMVAKEIAGKRYKVAVAYGTSRRPERYLRFKAFGRFIEPLDVNPTALALESSDNLIRKEEEPTSEEAIASQVVTESNIEAKEPDDMPF